MLHRSFFDCLIHVIAPFDRSFDASKEVRNDRSSNSHSIKIYPFLSIDHIPNNASKANLAAELGKWLLLFDSRVSPYYRTCYLAISHYRFLVYTIYDSSEDCNCRHVDQYYHIIGRYSNHIASVIRYGPHFTKLQAYRYAFPVPYSIRE